MPRLILGINSDHGDSSAALVSESGPLAAIAEERINRKKHSADFPMLAIQEVLNIAGADIRELSDIVVARDPKANLLQKSAYLARHPQSGIPMAVKRFGVHRKVRGTAERIAEGLGVERDRIRAEFHQVEHHLAHVASAFYWSPFERCCALTNDGAGDFATTMWAGCQGNDIDILRRSYWPHSLGVFYTAFCQFIGFDKYGEEYKVMGLSAFGKNRYSALMRDIVSFHPRMGLRLNLDYFDHQRSPSTFETIVDGEIVLSRLWGQRLEKALGPARRRDNELAERERDIAASVQARYEEVFLDMVAALVKKTGRRDIVMAGGCALNSVANGRMISEGYVDNAYFQPAASDDGTAIGAALHILHSKYKARRSAEVRHAFWGTEARESAIRGALVENGRPFKELSREELLQTAARAIADGKIIGWFQGREEWGPRALGNRSILCNPAVPDMKAILNSRIKNREPFRPFAPVIRQEDMSTVFEGTHPVPFMIVVFKVRPRWRAKLPAITHEDNTGRVQTVAQDENEIFYDLITTFKDMTGIPALLNTSFNENEPIVHTPQQAVDCFERTRMDCLGIGPFWIEK
ncbi:MAG: carbamoyltransferase [Deltaproteobacteria bacterium]|nr:carbamoyltransferase [Deltaproteobacteria bacterium]